jgi:adenosine deaminase
MIASATFAAMRYTEVYNSHTVSPELEARIRAMPKVEIHVHLEGATSPETIFEMAQRNAVALPAPTLDAWRSFYTFRDFNHFIEVYLTAVACMRTPEDFAAMAEDFVRRQAAQNVRYSEVYFSPSLHFSKLGDDEVIAALAQGARDGEAEAGSRVRFIADISRESPQLQGRVLDFTLRARERAPGLFVGLGVGGPEVGHPPEDFTDTFAEARRQGLRVVAHAGETEGAASVRGALHALQAERIGHGIRALDDPSVVAELRECGAPVEVSPQSNYCLGVVQRNQPHPIRRMRDAGLNVSVNSDDPPMFSTNLNNDYLTLAAQCFTFDELWAMNLAALDASFLPTGEKAALRREFDGFVRA